MDRDIQQLLKWLKLYEQSGDDGLLCRRCGISRTTLRKWWRLYQLNGTLAVSNHSRYLQLKRQIKTCWGGNYWTPFAPLTGKYCTPINTLKSKDQEIID